jgi:hypothetical protein
MAALCRAFLRGQCSQCPCPQGLHTPFVSRPPCDTFSRLGRCAFGACCHFPHEARAPPLFPGLHPSHPLPAGFALAFLFAHASHDKRAHALALEAGLHAAPPLPAAAQGALKREARCVPVVGASAGTLAASLVATPLLRACLERAMPAEARFDQRADAECWLRARYEVAAAAAAAAGCPPLRLRARVFPRSLGAAGVEAAVAPAAAAGDEGGAGALVFACLAQVCGGWHTALVPKGSAWDLPEGGADGETSEPTICRAQRKLEEALARRSTLRARAPVCAASVAVDLGAAPGGWALVLSRLYGKVLAVDPAELALAQLPAGVVVHVAQRAEEFLAAGAGGAGWACATCDANVPTRVALEWLKIVLPRLGAGAPFVWTLKNFSGGVRAWRGMLERVAERVAGWGAEGVDLLHLVANGPAEITLVGRRHALAAAPG